MVAIFRLSFLGIICALVLYVNPVVAQNLIKGTIVDGSTNVPIFGANVVVKGSLIGTTTDITGSFQLTVPTVNDTLVVTFIGYERQEVPLIGRETLNIVLNPEVLQVAEYIVVGYGIQEKINLTGSVGVVNARQIENRAVTSLSEALQGQVSGLQLVRTSGQPGRQQIDYKIRGTSTFSNNPVLTIIDGVPSSLDQINPNDIESISVLKDAASAAIYGSRATGGVILVTTRKGKPGTPQFSYSSLTSVQSPTRHPEKPSALDYALTNNLARANDGGSPLFTAQEIARFSSPDWKDHDWDGYMLNNSLQSNINLSVSGGNEIQQYYLSLGYVNQDGIVMNTGYQRFNIQLNQDIKVRENLKFSFKGGYAPSSRTAPASDYLNNLLVFTYATGKNEAFKSEDGKWLRNSTNTGGGNPLALASKDGGEQVLNSDRLTGSFTLTYDLLKNLNITGNYGIVNTQSRQRDYRKKITLYSQENPEVVSLRSVDNFLDVNYAQERLNTISFIGNYSGSWNKHSFTLLGGYTAEWFENSNDYLATRDFLTDDVYVISAGSSNPSLWSIAGRAADWALTSYISRVSYNYDGRYLFETNMRYDGSSRFTEDKRWGFFPSVSAGWIISDEAFLRNNSVLTFMKLRASWGSVGNQNVGFYPFANTLVQSAYYFNSLPQRAVTTGNAPNPDLTWETKESINIGIDGSIYSNLFEWSFDIFNEKTRDILLLLPLPTTFGQAAPVQNAGRVDNKGWEIELRHRNSIGGFTYGVSFHVSDATETVVDMGGISPRIIGSTITEEGYPINMWYGWRAIGFFNTTGDVSNAPFQNPGTTPGDIQYQNNGGDPNVINSEDRIRLGRSDPRFPYGLRITMNYKNFDFIGFGQGVMDHLVWTRNWEMTTLRQYHMDYWTPENQNARFPKPRVGGGPGVGINKDFSSFWLENAAYFRIKHIEIGYTLPNEMMRRLGIRGSRVFLSGENLFTFTNYLGYDPEIATGVQQRLVETRYPLAKVYNFGINVNF